MTMGGGKGSMRYGPERRTGPGVLGIPLIPRDVGAMASAFEVGTLPRTTRKTVTMVNHRSDFGRTNGGEEGPRFDDKVVN